MTHDPFADLLRQANDDQIAAAMRTVAASAGAYHRALLAEALPADVARDLLCAWHEIYWEAAMVPPTACTRGVANEWRPVCDAPHAPA